MSFLSMWTCCTFSQSRHNEVIINPSYSKLFRTHTKEGAVSRTPYPPPPTILSALCFINVKFCRILEMPLKVSENYRLLNTLLFGYHGHCSMTFFLIIVKMFMKTYNFQMFSEAKNFKVLK